MSPFERTAAGSPLVSIVLTGRNDGYGGDFLWRLCTTLRFNDRELRRRHIPYEVVFVEWAPPENTRSLSSLVTEMIPELDRDRCVWYSVDARYQTELSMNARLAYLEFIAKNVGVRRARGRFVLTTNCDVFLGRAVVDAFERDALKPRVIYRAPRYDIHLDAGQEPDDLAALEDEGILDGPVRTLKPPFMSGGTGDFLMLDRETFHEMRGFNEVYRVARFGIDRNFIVKALSSGLTIEDIGGPVYHISHEGSYRASPGAYAGREEEAHWGDRRWHSRGVIYENPLTWGLSHAPVRREGEQHWRIEFSWDAVPPLVDLKRIVLPVSRVGGPVPGRYVSRS